jgi:branched-chain amino acid transport system permease protein
MLALIISGIVIGCIYALIAAGYAIVYRTTGVLNFAQGSFVMLSGMTCAWLISKGWSYPLAALGGLVFTIAAGAAIWMLLMAPMLIRRLGVGLAVIATLVVSYALTDAVLLWQGPNPQSLPAIQPTFQFTVGGTRISSGQVYVIIGMALILILLSAFLKYTPLGRATRASAADHETAQLLGISPVRVGGYAMCIAAAVGALGGLLITPIQFTSASGATSLALYGFVAAVLGGFGRLSGGVIGGLVIGVLQELVGRYISTAYSDAITFAVLIAVLLLRPQGLLGMPNYGRARRARGGKPPAAPLAPELAGAASGAPRSQSPAGGTSPQTSRAGRAADVAARDGT